MFSAVSILKEPLAEPVLVADFKHHGRIDFDDDDDLLAGYITTARMFAEQYLGRALINQQLAWVIAREEPRNGFPFLSIPLTLLVLPLWFQWPFANRGAMELPRLPVQSVDAVAYGQWGSPDTVLTPGVGYGVDIASGRLLIYAGAQVIPNDHLIITFTAGYGLTGADVPMPIVQAIKMLATWLYENRGDVGSEWPGAVRMLLAPYRLTTFG